MVVRTIELPAEQPARGQLVGRGRLVHGRTAAGGGLLAPELGLRKGPLADAVVVGGARLVVARQVRQIPAHPEGALAAAVAVAQELGHGAVDADARTALAEGDPRPLGAVVGVEAPGLARDAAADLQPVVLRHRLLLQLLLPLARGRRLVRQGLEGS